MFPLHDRHRRLLFRAAFILTCALPTVAVAAWCARWQSNRPRDALVNELRQTLGLRVTIDDLSQPSPGVLLATDVELFDPESGELVLATREVQISRVNEATVIYAAQPECDADRLASLWTAVERRWRCAAPDEKSDVRLLAGEMTLRSGERRRTLADVRLQIEHDAQSIDAKCSFRLAGVEQGAPARFRATRDRGQSSTANSFELHTGDAWLPCGLLLPQLGIANRFSPDCEFRGSLRSTLATDGRAGELNGQFRGIELNSLVSEQFPHHLSGAAALAVDARFEHGRLSEAVGELTAGPGVASRSLLEAAAIQLKLVVAGQPIFQGDLAKYDRLAAAFTIDQRGVTIQGRCADGPPGTLLTAAGQPVLSETGHSLPVVALVRTLVPSSATLVPATTATDWLNPLLPLPDIVAASKADGDERPHAPTAHLRPHTLR